MSMSESARFASVEALLDAALEKPEGEREACLHLQEADAAIRTEVLELLRAVDASEGFLEAPAVPAG